MLICFQVCRPCSSPGEGGGGGGLLTPGKSPTASAERFTTEWGRQVIYKRYGRDHMLSLGDVVEQMHTSTAIGWNTSPFRVSPSGRLKISCRFSKLGHNSSLRLGRIGMEVPWKEIFTSLVSRFLTKARFRSDHKRDVLQRHM